MFQQCTSVLFHKGVVLAYSKSFHSFSLTILSSACAAVLLTACGGGSAVDEPQSVVASQSGINEGDLLPAGGDIELADSQSGESDFVPDAPGVVPTDSTDQTDASTVADSSTVTAGEIDSSTTTATEAGSVVPTTTYSGTYHLYVATTGSDTNTGTKTAPLRTIQKAASKAKPGTVVHVAPGTYKGTFTTSASGTASANIVYVSDVKWGAKIVPASSTSDSTGWQVTGNYVVVDGFDIDGQSTLGWRRGITAKGNYVTLKNNRVHHIAQRSACDSSGGSGITVDGYYGAHHHTVLNNVTHNIGPAGCGKYHGIYVASFDYTAKNNLVYQVSGPGIFGNHDSGRGYIINNTVFRSGKGILVSGADFIRISAAGPFTIQNNVVYDNNAGSTRKGNIAGIGIYGKQVAGSKISNNYVYNNRDVELYMISGAGTISGNITSGAPGFVNYQIDGSGNYGLTASSILVNKGVSTYAPPNDLAGISRPQGSGIDIGAYEYKVN